MKLNPGWYVNWGLWAFQRLQRAEGPERDRFLADLHVAVSSLLSIADDWPKGSGIVLFLSAASWIGKHRDPLEAARTKMEQMRHTYS